MVWVGISSVFFLGSREKGCSSNKDENALKICRLRFAAGSQCDGNSRFQTEPDLLLKK